MSRVLADDNLEHGLNNKCIQMQTVFKHAVDNLLRNIAQCLCKKKIKWKKNHVLKLLLNGSHLLKDFAIGLELIFLTEHLSGAKAVSLGKQCGCMFKHLI